ncbi:MAG: hypothetical protein A3J97_08890 [Spirochaetes bacterium RIFOXYC1_FULL_54_7]|nr:MAG: hypothetical protein A3J97_08890 [Spirochaetes bacterium RIFOXYC1_FULL_54_7]
MFEVNEIVNGCYILRHRVGEDTFSEWWQATAIFVASNFLLRFIKDEYAMEERLVKTFFENGKKRIPVVSPAILGLIEIDRHNGRYFIASEYNGQTHLKSILEAGRRFSVEHTCRLMIELATGIEILHMHDQSFGVLTPDCVAIHGVGDGIDEFKLLLPGYETLFKLIPQENEVDFVGAWGYASPEFKKGMETDSRSDIYSLGILLFRLIVGKLPYGSRAGIKVRTQSAAPANIAAALARRGTPRELVAATVRALRKNPELRQADLMSFIEELRGILESRRKAWIKAGEPDPIADLATLNLKKAKADSKEIVRSLESVEYFNHSSQSDRVELLIPIEMTEVDKKNLELEVLEELESSEAEDDDTVATEAYVEAGYEAAMTSTKASAFLSPRMQKNQPAGKIREESTEGAIEKPTAKATVKPDVKSTEKKAAKSLEPQPMEQVEPPASPVSTANPASIAKPAKRTKAAPVTEDMGAQGTASIAAVPVKTPRVRKTPTRVIRGKAPVPFHINWRQAGGSPKEVAETIIMTAARAQEGFGIVKFIEDPGSSDPDRQILKAIQSLQVFARVVDLGMLRGNISLGKLIKTLEYLIPDLALKEPESKESEVKLASRVAKAVAACANRDKPIILVAWDTESVARSAHQLILQLATIAPGIPVCAFLFFKTGRTRPWHILANITDR